MPSLNSSSAALSLSECMKHDYILLPADSSVFAWTTSIVISTPHHMSDSQSVGPKAMRFITQSGGGGGREELLAVTLSSPHAFMLETV